MNKILSIFLVIYSINVSGQKIKIDDQTHILKTYPTFNLPEDVYTYDVNVIISDGAVLSDYNLTELLKDNCMKLEYFRRDSLKGRLLVEVFIEERPCDRSYSSSTDPSGKVEYKPVLISRYAGSLAVYLDYKMIDFKIIDFSRPHGIIVNPSNTNYQPAFIVPSPSPSLPEHVNSQLSVYTSSYYDKQAMIVNRQQILQIFSIASTYIKSNYDINYNTASTTLYRVKNKEGEYYSLDTTHKAALSTLKIINKQNYTVMQDQLMTYLQFWKEEKLKFNAKIPTESPYIWAICMNIATVSDLLDDYTNAMLYWKEADYIGVDRKESSRLRNKIQNRASAYNSRYNENGSLKGVSLVYLDRKKPEEDYRIRYEKERKEYELKVEREKVAEAEAERLAREDRYKYIILKQPGTVETLDGKKISGLISYSSDLVTMGGMPYNNRVYLYDPNNKDSDKHETYNPEKLIRFSLADGAIYESVEIELNTQEKAKNLLMAHKRFYKLLYKSPFITLYSYNSHDVHQHTFKLAGSDIGYCTGFGGFQVSPNKTLAELLKKSPIVSTHVANSGTNIFTDQSLIQICESYTNSLNK